MDNYHNLPQKKEDRRALRNALTPAEATLWNSLKSSQLAGRKLFAGFLADPDSETNFKLFGPVVRPHGAVEAPARVFALRLRPNQDFCTALEDFCRSRGLSRAKLHGGVGSIIGARFAGGRVSEPFATEIAVTGGVVAAGSRGDLRAEIDIALIDHTGAIAQGRLQRGNNPVLMTMELVLEAL